MDYFGNNDDHDKNAHDPFSNHPFFNSSDIPPKQEPPHRPKRPKGNKKVKIVAFGLVCLLLGVAIQPLYRTITGNGGTTVYSGDRSPTTVNVTSVNTEKEMTTAEIYAKYAASSVGITVDIVSTNVFGQTVTGAAAGSGFVITEDGYILTNYHVIDGANSIKVTFVDGKEYSATVIGGEEKNDIAVIKIEAKGLTPVVIGKSTDMLVGEQVTTIGNPLGELTFSETTGIISALNRTITMSDGTEMNMIQTDCAINSGNSGGPLFNSHGEVIGIVSAKYSSGGSSSAASVEGLGFAIPIDDVSAMVNDLIEKGYVTGKPYLGIIMSQEGVDDSAQAYGVPAGVLVLGVTDGLPAQKAGVQANDIITKADGKALTASGELANIVNSKKPGDTLLLTVYRNGQTQDVKVTLIEATTETEAATAKLSDEIQKQQQEKQKQQQEQQQGSGFWPFGFGY